MKKTLLFFALGSSLMLNAQVLVNENVSSLTAGNVGTDLTGTVPGQGGWSTFVLADGSNSDFQVIDAGGNYGNVFQITGSSTNANSRRLYKDIAGDWGFREAGNNVAEIQVDFFTGPETTSANSMRIVLYDGALTKMLCGIMINMSTLVMSGLSYYDNTAAAGGVLGNYSFKLGYTTTPTPGYLDVTLERNMWYKVGASYNYTTGEVIFKESTGLITSPPVMGASAGTEVAQANMVMTAITTTGQANSVSAVGLFDNYLVQASAVSGPLAVTTLDTASSRMAIYPNPVMDVISISNGKNISIKNIAISDLNGRIIKQSAFDGAPSVQMNVSDLSSGIYMMSISTSDGIATKKFIKD